MDYLAGLNEQQREAVLHKDGPIMIIAGAGSGKTRVLTTRIAHLLATGVDPFRILGLTFTNKAAAEMRERIEKMLGSNQARNLYIGTFHSVFARILRADAEKMGYPRNFSIYDTDDSKSVLKAIIKEMGLSDKVYKPSSVYNRISAAKNSLITCQEYMNDFVLQNEDMKSNRPMIGTIYSNYAQRCFRNGAMDFDDLLLKFYQLLTTFPESLSKYQRKFQYIMIDEYQDTNNAQYQIIKLLGAMHENVAVVGDDAQSIYSFRGATIENILRFKSDYEDAKIVKLEQNYRSSQNILNAANSVISKNKGQIPKKLWTSNVEGEKIKLVRTNTDNDEAKYVADQIQEQKLRNHYQNSDFAILYRTNAQSRSFEENLRRMNIPYRIYGGISFYQRKEIKDFLAYLRVVINPYDEEALKRIINYPARGIGKTTVEKAVLTANQNNLPMWEVLKNAAMGGFRGNTAETIRNFVLMIEMFESELERKNAYDLAVLVGKHTGLVKELFNDKTTEGLVRYENVQELLNAIKEFTSTPTEDGELLEKSLGSYLQQITLLTDADEDKGDNNVVKLMTIHAAKGLEFPVVFVGGLEENLFPSGMSINTLEELEEERRLFYVAITRAKSRLYLTYANTRYKFGQLIQNDPSRFVEELPEEQVDRSFAGLDSNYIPAHQRMSARYQNAASLARKRYGPPQNHKEPVTYTSGTANPKVHEHSPSAGFLPSDVSNIKMGSRVEHQRFGFGEVIKLEGAAHNPIATIRFEKNGEKKIMLNYAKLMVHDE
jgi:DNA helicase-2/ATP-dependent DNA helicase PcrA